MLVLPIVIATKVPPGLVRSTMFQRIDARGKYTRKKVQRAVTISVFVTMCAGCAQKVAIPVSAQRYTCDHDKVIDIAKSHLSQHGLLPSNCEFAAYSPSPSTWVVECHAEPSPPDGWINCLIQNRRVVRVYEGTYCDEEIKVIIQGEIQPSAKSVD